MGAWRPAWRVRLSPNENSRTKSAGQVADGKVSKQLAVDHAPSGGHYELECTTAGMRGFNDAFLAEIAKASS